MKEVVIVSAVRTAIGKFGGTLSPLSAVEFGTVTAKGAMEQAGIDPGIIDEVVIGNVLSAGLGQSVARQIALKSGMKETVSAFNIDKVCGSGLRAVSLAAQMIKAGDCDVVLAGGVESMSNAPYLSKTSRFGSKMGNVEMVDLILSDGLTDAYGNGHMGITAENIADKWGITREEQDAFAAGSQQKAVAAIESGRFKDEIVPVTIPNRKGDIVFDTDEFPRAGTTAEGLGKLRPAFKKEGTVTAGNASGINDGAAMVVVMSKEKADELGLKPMAKIVSYASEGLDPAVMGYGPYGASNKALAKAGMTTKDIDLFELNEAFASQSIAVVRDLEIDPEIVNVNGGAIALGHPIGASGARIFVTLLHEMKKRESKTGLASLCIGGGQGTTVIVEAM